MSNNRIEALANIIKYISPLSDKKVDWIEIEDIYGENIGTVYSCKVNPKADSEFGPYVIHLDADLNNLTLDCGSAQIVFGENDSEVENNLIKKLSKDIAEYIETKKARDEDAMLEKIKAEFI